MIMLFRLTQSLSGNPLEVIEKLNRYKMNEMILLNINTVGTKSGVNLDAIRQVLDVTGHRLSSRRWGTEP